MRTALLVGLCMLIGAVAFGQEKKTHMVDLSIEGMSCGSCASKIDKALKGVEGVQDVSVSVEKGAASVVLADASTVSHENLLKAVADAGYKASVKKAEMKSAKKEVKVTKEVKKEGDDCCGAEGGCETEKTEVEKIVKKKKE